MPALRFRVSATTTDAMANRKFNVLPAVGTIMNLWASCVTATDTFGLSIGDRDILVNGSSMNIEASADVVDTDRDQLVFNELCGGGQLFLPVTVTTEAQFLIILRYGPF
jgi:hypothetical protein